jgi:hypothetical protein
MPMRDRAGDRRHAERGEGSMPRPTPPTKRRATKLQMQIAILLIAIIVCVCVRSAAGVAADHVAHQGDGRAGARPQRGRRAGTARR